MPARRPDLRPARGRGVVHTQTARLEAVKRWIHDFGDLGSIDDPGQYFGGLLSMRWGPYGFDFKEGEEGMVYFGGVTDRTILGLGGSSRHLIGSSSGDAATFSHSATPAILAALESDQAGLDVTLSDDLGLIGVELATTQQRGPTQALEFVAKRLLDGPGRQGKRILLGTPLYVALAE